MITAIVTDAVETATEHEEVFYQSAEFWVGASFVLIVCLLFSPIAKVVKQLMQQRIERIKNELHEAETLKLDAQKLYAEYERKFINTEQEVADIITNQQNFISQTKEKKILELEQLLKHKQREADARIELSLEQAKADINSSIAENTLYILNQIIRLKLTKNDHSKLIDNSIEQIRNLEIGGKNG